MGWVSSSTLTTIEETDLTFLHEHDRFQSTMNTHTPPPRPLIVTACNTDLYHQSQQGLFRG